MDTQTLDYMQNNGSVSRNLDRRYEILLFYSYTLVMPTGKGYELYGIKVERQY